MVREVWIFGSESGGGTPGADRLGHSVESWSRIAAVASQVADAREGVGTMLQRPWLGEERGEELGAPCGGWGRGDRGGPCEEEGGRLQFLNRLESLWQGGEACEAKAVAQQRRPQLLFLWRPASVAVQDLVGVVDEVAAGAVWAEAYRVESAARLRLVLGVPA